MSEEKKWFEKEIKAEDVKAFFSKFNKPKPKTRVDNLEVRDGEVVRRSGGTDNSRLNELLDEAKNKYGKPDNDSETIKQMQAKFKADKLKYKAAREKAKREVRREVNPFKDDSPFGDMHSRFNNQMSRSEFDSMFDRTSGTGKINLSIRDPRLQQKLDELLRESRGEEKVGDHFPAIIPIVILALIAMLIFVL
jgi:hypothetical protein